MKLQALLSLLIIFCTTLCLAQGSYGNCCLGHVRRMRANAIDYIESYRLQETDGDCNISAVVFTMVATPDRKKQRTVCADPGRKWVKKLKEAVDARAKISRR
ncbi:C-C motif chemokine 25-like [Nerophis ophidion]|uniref:C-C motif chemokine 25-like n=1 Tax=Nerophis ophidion TaxID=159077 RepID=UPI002ADFD2AB|nr:C-C motif chemokine 25-like [Nerophis ophidion]XP_061738971.1 C-C motif chemokine 25-like [Nerophis ophidion]